MLGRISKLGGCVAIACLGACLCALQGCASASSTQATGPGATGPGAAGSGSPEAGGFDLGAGSVPGAASHRSASQPAASHRSATASSPAAGMSSPATRTSSPAAHASSSSSSSGAAAGSGTFTAPAVSSAVQAHGSYNVINAHRMYVQVCAKKTGNVSAVGVEAIAYNSDYSLQGEIASIILPATPGQQGCTQTYLLYSAHLKVYTFIGSGGTITQKSAMKTIF